MRKGQPRRWAIYPYTDKELAVIALCVKGIKPPEIAMELGLTLKTAYKRLSRLRIKAGLKSANELTEWAYRNGLDAPLPPECQEDLPAPKATRTTTRIKMKRATLPKRRAGRPRSKVGGGSV